MSNVKKSLITNMNLMWLVLLFNLPVNAGLGQINIIMTATLTSNACTVSASSRNNVINMGTWSTRQFKTTPAAVPEVPFTITLEDCGATASGVSISFKGTEDSHDTTLLSLSGENSAKNIAIAILDSQKNRIALGQNSPVFNLTPNQSRMDLKFYGQYVATGGEITAGVANADAIFTLEYF